ncbi:MAG TPA: DUF4360 domain-containing protein [Oligoflexus sp.]|uniref:DUF4360 domain-containing protein n=1 Tax=Oligoflexus sp. TaxID=1971216 RepID=UPI002D226F58|nr:DUF4360 domain-containing protein [Oligoflexus sp.]HYX33043.1 DUF4360 domain-containing protein [Oligoflexus sp.]
MKHVIMATALIPACFILACGTKKTEKNVPVVIENQSSDSTAQTQIDTNLQCNIDGVNQSQECQTANLAVGQIVVIQQNSWLNPRFDDNGIVQNHDGICLEKFTAGGMNDVSLASWDMNLASMHLQDQAARCRMQIRVAYKKGYAFAIRRVEVPLMGQIPVDSQAVFDGSYGIQDKNPLVIQKTLETRYSDKPLRLDHTVADQNIVWSSCSGQSELRIDTALSLNSSGSGSHGDLRIEGSSPYRFEVLWAKCL